MTNSEQVGAFYDAIKLSNAIAKEQSNNALSMALVGSIAKAIEGDQSPEKIKQLIELKRNLEEI